MISERLTRFGALFYVVIALSLLAILVSAVPPTSTTGANNTSAVSVSGIGSFPGCEGGNIDNVQSDAMKKCLRFKDLFEQYRVSSGLDAIGIDLLFLFTTAKNENGCRSYAAGDEGGERGGILQVDRPCYYNPEQCPTTESEIDWGTKQMNSGMVRMREESGLSGTELLWMSWFAYNRGFPTARNAWTMMREEGKTIQEATAAACESAYAQRESFDCSLGKYSQTRSDYGCPDGESNPVCTNGKTCAFNFYCRIKYEDVGVHYADKMWHTYTKNCQEIGGTITSTPSTGAAVGEAGAPAASSGPGTPSGFRPDHPYFSVPYSVNPSFSTTIDYDFSIYDTVQDKIRKLERCRDSIECIVNNVSIIEQEDSSFDWIVKYGGNVLSKDEANNPEYPAWEAYCESPDEHAVNSLAEAIDVCAKSQLNDCYCDYNLPVVSTEDISGWYSAAISTGLSTVPLVGPVLGIASNAVLSLVVEWNTREIGLRQASEGIRVWLHTEQAPDPQLVRGARFHDIHPDIRGDMDHKFIYNSGDRGKSIHIYKHPNSTISLYPADGSPSTDKCELHNKNVKFCIVQNNSFFAYDEAENRMGLQQLVLKFAYLFKSEVTDVRNIEIRDAVYAKDTALIVWDPLPGVDVREYTIYRSENTAMEANLRDRSPADLSDDERIELDPKVIPVDDKQPISILIDSLDTPSCIVDQNTCVKGYSLDTAMGEEMSDALLDEETLYHSTSEDRFFYFLPEVVDGTHYYYAITATDVNDEESPGFNTPLPAMHDDSEDDAPPALAVVQTLSTDGVNVQFTTDAVNKNIDDTDLGEADIRKVRIYCLQEAVEDLDLSSKTYVESHVTRTDTSMVFQRPIVDFNQFSCGASDAVFNAKFIIVPAKRIGNSDRFFDGMVSPRALSTQTIPII